jgi:cyclase
MLRPRIIPCLLVKNKGLVKTVNFKQPKYVGDPINAVRIFNEKSVDELIVIDIDSTTQQLEPDYKMIENIAAECRMPLCYGGGVKSVEQAERIFSLGVEKVAISSAAIEKPDIIAKIASHVGSQSIIVVLDVKKNVKTKKYELWTNNATKNTGIDPVQFAIEIERIGAGEVVLNSIDNDGMMKGYDLEIVEQVRNAISVPMSVVGGAGSLADIGQLINKFGIIGAVAGSLFVFKGVYKAVLINYPGKPEKEKILIDNFHI